MNGPKTVTETYERTHEICPRCENQFVDYRKFTIQDSGGTLNPIPPLPIDSGMCFEIDESAGALWVYYHTTETLDNELANQISGMKELVRKIQEEHDGDPGAPQEEVIEQAKAKGFTPDRAEQEIQKLRDKGEIYSPNRDYLRLV